jgi:hypothetical protein
MSPAGSSEQEIAVKSKWLQQATTKTKGLPLPGAALLELVTSEAAHTRLDAS